MAGSAVILFCITGKDSPIKPVLQFGINFRPDYSVVWQSISVLLVFFVLAAYLQVISNDSTVRGGTVTAANYKLIFLETLLGRAPFLETRPPSRFVLAVG